MRTFHTGGVAGGDITRGSSSCQELFEARKPKGLAIITEFSGVANIKDTKKKREIVVTNNETGESKAYLIPYGSRIKVQDGAELEAGDELTEGRHQPPRYPENQGCPCGAGLHAPGSTACIPPPGCGNQR